MSSAFKIACYALLSNSVCVTQNFCNSRAKFKLNFAEMRYTAAISIMEIGHSSLSKLILEIEIHPRHLKIEHHMKFKLVLLDIKGSGREKYESKGPKRQFKPTRFRKICLRFAFPNGDE